MIPWLHIYTLKHSLISHPLSIFIEMTVFTSEVLTTVHPKKKEGNNGAISSISLIVHACA